MVHLFWLWFTTLSKSRSPKVYQKARLYISNRAWDHGRVFQMHRFSIFCNPEGVVCWWFWCDMSGLSPPLVTCWIVLSVHLLEAGKRLSFCSQPLFFYIFFLSFPHISISPGFSNFMQLIPIFTLRSPFLHHHALSLLTLSWHVYMSRTPCSWERSH